MGFNFDQNRTKVPELSSQNLKWLAECDGKIVGVKAQIITPEVIAASNGFIAGMALTPEGAEGELKRLARARKTLMKQLTADEKVEYKAWIKASKPRPLSKEEQAAAVKKMNENKDRPSH